MEKREVISAFMLHTLIDTEATGKIHSRFQTSFNIEVADQLFHFATVDSPLSAHGCLLEKGKIKQLLAAGKIGDVVRVKQDTLHFYTRNEIIRIHLKELSEVDLTIPVIQKSAEELSEMVLYQTLGNLQLEEKIGLDVNQQIEDIFTVLKSSSQYPPDEIKKKVHPLIGRGQGLTPSGDDILMGYLMVNKALGKEHMIEDYLKKLPLREITTMVSAAYYQALFAGSISHLFLQLLLTLEETNEIDLSDLIYKIGLYGHTSGYDTLLGVYLGLQSLINEKKVLKNLK